MFMEFRLFFLFVNIGILSFIFLYFRQRAAFDIQRQVYICLGT